MLLPIKTASNAAQTANTARTLKWNKFMRWNWYCGLNERSDFCIWGSLYRSCRQNLKYDKPICSISKTSISRAVIPTSWRGIVHCCLQTKRQPNPKHFCAERNVSENICYFLDRNCYSPATGPMPHFRTTRRRSVDRLTPTRKKQKSSETVNSKRRCKQKPI